MKLRRHSLTVKKASGSASVRRADSMDVVRRETRASHSSSTSLVDRNVPVVSRTCDSMIKKPEISCVSDGSEASGRDVGRMRSDCAYIQCKSAISYIRKRPHLSVRLV